MNARDAAGNVSQASTHRDDHRRRSARPTRTPPTAPTQPDRHRSPAPRSRCTWTARHRQHRRPRLRRLPRRRARSARSPAPARPPATTFIDSGLAANTDVLVRVVARDAQGNASAAQQHGRRVTTGAACGSAVCAVTQVGTDTDIPWGLATLPDGTILYTRRDAHDIVRLDPATGAKTNVGTVPNVQSTDGEGGLLGLAISPTFATDQLAVPHAHLADGQPDRADQAARTTRSTPAREQVLLSGHPAQQVPRRRPPALRPGRQALRRHRRRAERRQRAEHATTSTARSCGSTRTGRVPSDNPFGNYVWSYGHRNPQGLAFDSQGRLWEQEFGNSVMDETNLITKGGNYGWPACEGTSGTLRHRRVHRAQAHLPDRRGLVLRHRDRARRALRRLRSAAPGCTARSSAAAR